MMDKEPLKVSDWSQPIKIGLMVFALVGAGIFALHLIQRLDKIIDLLQYHAI